MEIISKYLLVGETKRKKLLMLTTLGWTPGIMMSEEAGLQRSQAVQSHIYDILKMAKLETENRSVVAKG